MKITLTQAKAIARTFFGGACKFAGNISDEPDKDLYHFTNGIFSLEIPGGDNVDEITVVIMNEIAGTIDLSDPIDFAFIPLRSHRHELNLSGEDNPADVLGGQV